MNNELNVKINNMQRIQEQSGVFLRKSWKLSEKANGIAKLLGMGSSEVICLVNENLFGEFSEMEPTRLGCPKAIAIPRLMAYVTIILHYRCDPSDRVFHMNTTRKSVYQREPILTSTSWSQDNSNIDEFIQTRGASMKSTVIALRDHEFDKKKRSRKKRTSKRSDVSKPLAVARDVEPIHRHH
ncbi:uncharacterized protein LOC127831062 [Dreissena polymorpha]|uniref:uncharacterized protein LOC127831062 n=1 Tax=Dreissena polymorpha TaxID=45954 RepID=UPI0022650830|nr:uncharacterized protein LOC127831062 [Dreissena polymorpha]